MKVVILLFTANLLLINAWGKGGDNPWIPEEIIEDRLTAMRQTKIMMVKKENSNDFNDVAMKFNNYLYQVDQKDLSQFTVNKGGKIAFFCLTAESIEKKLSLDEKIKESLNLYTKNSLTVLYIEDLLVNRCD